MDVSELQGVVIISDFIRIRPVSVLLYNRLQWNPCAAYTPNAMYIPI